VNCTSSRITPHASKKTEKISPNPVSGAEFRRQYRGKEVLCTSTRSDMPQRKTDDGSWTHVYREGIFGGSLNRLVPGDETKIDAVGSIIVGPRAVAHIVTAGGQEIASLEPRMFVKDISDLGLPHSPSYLRVSASPEKRRR
jgi:hypothetical protein